MGEPLNTIIGNTVYGLQALAALWGAFCVIVVWMRVGAKRFKTEDQQVAFLQAIEEPLMKGDFDTAAQICEGDSRALCQMAHMAITNRGFGYAKVKQLIIDRFQRDVLADLEYRVTWVKTVIASAPMLGLLGTVLGMMGAFGKLAGASNVDPTQLAGDIQFALITTAVGLSIAIPLIVTVSVMNIRIAKMEDLVTAGLGQFLEIFKDGLDRAPKKSR